MEALNPDGTSGRNRTGTLLPETDFESVASTSSATEARGEGPSNAVVGPLSQRENVRFLCKDANPGSARYSLLALLRKPERALSHVTTRNMMGFSNAGYIEST